MSIAADLIYAVSRFGSRFADSKLTRRGYLKWLVQGDAYVTSYFPSLSTGDPMLVAVEARVASISALLMRDPWTTARLPLLQVRLFKQRSKWSSFAGDV